MISQVLLYLLMSTCMLTRESSKEVKWTVRDTSPKLGQDLTLFCKVDNCTVHEAKRWYGGPDKKSLMSNSGVSTDKAKYNTLIENNGFILTILNLAVTDLNVSYECSCGFVLDKHILYIEDLYKVDNLNKSTNGANCVGTKYAAGLPVIIISIILVIVLITVIVTNRHCLWGRLKEMINGPRGRNSDEVDSQNVTDPLLQTIHVDSNLRQCSDEVDSQNVTDPILQATHVDSNLRQCSDEVDSQNVTDPILQATHVDSNLRQCSDEVDNQNVTDPILQATYVDSNLRQCSDEVDSQNVTDPLSQTTHVDSNLRQSADLDDNLHRSQLLQPPQESINRVTVQQPQESINRVTAAESFEPSISWKASSKIVEVKQIGIPTSTSTFQRTSTSITGTEKKESSETNSHRLPSKPGSSLSYSIRDDSTSTCPGKSYKYADIKLRELSFKTWPLNKPSIVQLAEAGFFQSGDKNIVQCFSCENKLYCNEGQDPLDGAFHNNCEYLREIRSTQLKTAYSRDQ